MALAIAVLLGVLYGTYPALKASRMMPVDALRSAG
jgi:ABC-type antimicrobial peptide transport system permease subunit